MNNHIKEKLSRSYLIICIVVSLISGLIIGLLISLLFDYQPSTKTEIHETGYPYISPLLECFSEKSDSPENYKLKQEIKESIASHISNKDITEASLYFRDLANGPWIGINENEKFTPASLLKVPVMITYYRLAEEDPNILKKEILIISDYEDKATPNIAPEIKAEIGKKYNVQTLIDYMIVESDNHATNALIANLPEGSLNETFTDLGLILPTTKTLDDYMTVKDYSSFFRILYNASYLNKYYSEKSLEILSQSKFTAGLVAGLPLNTKVSHKFGERKNGEIDQLHDCGIIYNKDYLLCIMTRGDNFDNLAKTIEDLSGLVYNNVN